MDLATFESIVQKACASQDDQTTWMDTNAHSQELNELEYRGTARLWNTQRQKYEIPFFDMLVDYLEGHVNAYNAEMIIGRLRDFFTFLRNSYNLFNGFDIATHLSKRKPAAYIATMFLSAASGKWGVSDEALRRLEHRLEQLYKLEGPESSVNIQAWLAAIDGLAVSEDNPKNSSLFHTTNDLSPSASTAGWENLGNVGQYGSTEEFCLQMIYMTVDAIEMREPRFWTRKPEYVAYLCMLANMLVPRSEEIVLKMCMGGATPLKMVADKEAGEPAWDCIIDHKHDHPLNDWSRISQVDGKWMFQPDSIKKSRWFAHAQASHSISWEGMTELLKKSKKMESLTGPQKLELMDSLNAELAYRRRVQFVKDALFSVDQKWEKVGGKWVTKSTDENESMLQILAEKIASYGPNVAHTLLVFKDQDLVSSLQTGAKNVVAGLLDKLGKLRGNFKDGYGFELAMKSLPNFRHRNLNASFARDEHGLDKVNDIKWRLHLLKQHYIPMVNNVLGQMQPTRIKQQITLETVAPFLHSWFYMADDLFNYDDQRMPSDVDIYLLARAMDMYDPMLVSGVHTETLINIRTSREKLQGVNFDSIRTLQKPNVGAGISRLSRPKVVVRSSFAENFDLKPDDVIAQATVTIGSKDQRVFDQDVYSTLMDDEANIAFLRVARGPRTMLNQSTGLYHNPDKSFVTNDSRFQEVSMPNLHTATFATPAQLIK